MPTRSSLYPLAEQWAAGNRHLSDDVRTRNVAINAFVDGFLSCAADPAGETIAHDHAEDRAKDLVRAARDRERKRMRAIITHAESNGRREMAEHLAFETDMPAEQATALLGKSPKASGQTPLERAMAANGTPGISNMPARDAVAGGSPQSPSAVYEKRRQQATGTPPRR